MTATRQSAGDGSRPGQMPDPMDRLRFPADPWRLTEAFYDSSDLGVTEALFAVANGYLGMRGNVEEGHDSHSHGTFINGFHETWPISSITINVSLPATRRKGSSTGTDASVSV